MTRRNGFFALSLMVMLAASGCDDDPGADQPDAGPCPAGYSVDRDQCSRWRRLQDAPRDARGQLLLLPDGRVLAYRGRPAVLSLDSESWQYVAEAPLDYIEAAYVVAGLVVASGQAQGSGKYLALWDPRLDVWSSPVPLATSSFSVMQPIGTDRILLVGRERITGEPRTWIYRIGPGVVEETLGVDPPSPTLVFATAARLGSGRILFAGGDDGKGAVASAYIYDPSSGRWSAAASMSTAREYITTLTLRSGDVVALGGYDDHQPLASAEIYSEYLDAWRPLPPLLRADGHPSVVERGEGALLVLFNEGPTAAAIYDPRFRRWEHTVEPPPILLSGNRWDAFPLPDDRLLIGEGPHTYLFDTL